MRLYGHPRSACTRKVLLAVAEKGHALELVHVDLMAGQHNRPEHLARHPFAKIPVLEDGAFTLYESGAILRYLDQKLFGMRLTPSGPRELARMEQWIGVESAYLGPAAWALVYQIEVRPKFGAEPDPIALARAQKEVARVFSVLDRELAPRADKGYLAGYTYTLADVCFMPALQMLEQAGQGELIARHAQLARWWKRMRGRPSFQKVVSGRAAARERTAEPPALTAGA